MTKLVDVEGIGAAYAGKLKTAGITSVEDLLKKGATPRGRGELAERTGISGKLILEWINHADLFRIKGVNEEYADLLEETGVDTVPELAQRNSDHLYEKIVALQQEKKLVRHLPGKKQVADWVRQAGQLPRIISY